MLFLPIIIYTKSDFYLRKEYLNFRDLEFKATVSTKFDEHPIKANKIYLYNRILKFIIAGYFFLNAYYSYKEGEKLSDKKQEELLVIATFFLLLGAAFYLPLGNSNLIIEN